jgi:hypothetical protein
MAVYEDEIYAEADFSVKYPQIYKDVKTNMPPNFSFVQALRLPTDKILCVCYENNANEDESINIEIDITTRVLIRCERATD